MSKQVSSKSANRIGDVLSITSYVQVSSKRSLDDCIFALKSNQGSSLWFGGYRLRFVLAKARGSTHDRAFVIEYFRLRYASSSSPRTSYLIQRMKGLLYEENGQTHLVAKVKFTASTLMWLWLAIILTLLSVGLLIFSGNIIMFVLIALTGTFLLSAIFVMWLDRYRLIQVVRRSLDA